ncbi:SIR2 family protein [Mesorhizobium sp.]|uniref:SIR2 family protein n=1 Tax=Mesorhizobium sp. TaxID=1871066 RepID=UPI0025EECD01|nr:SIR2 family protein [Mesorhizobium sp.]
MVALPAGVTAANISILKVLELLDGHFKETADGIANGEYVFWLGSAISKEKVDDLGKICRRILKHLWDKRADEGGAGAFTSAFHKAIGLAGLSDAEKASIDFTTSPETWAMIDDVVGRLVKKYSDLLSIVVTGKEADYLLWEVVDVPGTYANAGTEPDCEHFCVAILALEGLLANVATANWDGLVEKAVAQLSAGTAGILSVCVTAEDFGAGAPRTRLLKFHGCAVRAKANATVYRPYIVGRGSQILGWTADDNYKLMRRELEGLASKNPSLVVGLSIQDFNIKAVFAKGNQLKPHAFPSHPPAYVFAQQELGIDQEQLLQYVYGDQYARRQADIEESAKLPAYSKPLLTALVLCMLTKKLVAYSDRANAPGFGAADREAIAKGVLALRDRIAGGGDADRLAFVKAIIQRGSQLLSAFRGAAYPGNGTFAGLGILPVSQIANDPNLGTTGLPELANVAGILGQVANDNWTMSVVDGGAVEIDNAGAKRKVFFVATSDAAAGLVLDGTIDEDDPDNVVIICTAAAPRMKRNPTSAPGRVLDPDAATDVAVRSILLAAANADEAVQLFREQAGL